MQNSYFAITFDKETRLYRAKNFGSLMELLKLLWEVKDTAERTPFIDYPEAKRLAVYSKEMVSITPFVSNRLLQPIDRAAFDEGLCQLHAQPSEDRHIILDYDQNHFDFTEWSEDGLDTLYAPLDGMIAAYSGAIRSKGGKQTYINQNALAAEMKRISEVTSIKDFPEPDAPTPTLSM